MSEDENYNPKPHKRESVSWLEEATATARAPSCLCKLYFHFGEDRTGGSGALAESRAAPSLSGKAKLSNLAAKPPYPWPGASSR